jgi:23S rRNA (cytidine1920-2'-O)/16S rRNA (cytidine1409-2'-O)-methyltransferase
MNQAKRRLDAEMVRRGLARSRDHAAELIAAGAVKAAGIAARKPATQVSQDASIKVDSEDAGDDAYASRGAHKLAGALEVLAARGRCPNVEGLFCLDAGASTGGFTDVLLRRGAALVHAVDVGYGQLVWRLRQDARVQVHDRTNVRHLTAGMLDPAPQLVVADLSFISLRTVLPALKAVAAPGADFLVMVKPQFEVGRAKLPAGGVVSDPADRAGAVAAVAEAATALGLAVKDVVRSPLPGPSGNVEFFLLLGDVADDAVGDAAGGARADAVGDAAADAAGAPVADVVDDAVGQVLAGQRLADAIAEEVEGSAAGTSPAHGAAGAGLPDAGHRPAGAPANPSPRMAGVT